jgi:hypothetical protein
VKHRLNEFVFDMELLPSATLAQTRGAQSYEGIVVEVSRPRIARHNVRNMLAQRIYVSSKPGCFKLFRYETAGEGIGVVVA